MMTSFFPICDEPARLPLPPTNDVANLRRKLQADARARRRDFGRYAALHRGTPAAIAHLDAGVRVHLNPVRGWLPPEEPSPTANSDAAPDRATVLFAVGNEIRSLTVDAASRDLLHELAGLGPTTCDAWERHSRAFGCGAPRAAILDLVRRAADEGLVAVG